MIGRFFYRLSIVGFAFILALCACWETIIVTSSRMAGTAAMIIVGAAGVIWGLWPQE